MKIRMDRQLAQLNRELTEMGALCEDAIAAAGKALMEDDRELAKKVAPIERDIDRKERAIETLCLNLLLKQQPEAEELRQISAALKMITDMERIGDQTADIADIVMSTRFEENQSLADIRLMAEAAAKMVRDSVSAYVQKNLELARRVMCADDTVDAMFDKIKQELVDFISKRESTNADQAIDLIMIAKYLERIGDHATNIAEWVEFSITGTHASLAQL